MKIDYKLYWVDNWKWYNDIKQLFMAETLFNSKVMQLNNSYRHHFFENEMAVIFFVFESLNPTFSMFARSVPCMRCIFKKWLLTYFWDFLIEKCKKRIFVKKGGKIKKYKNVKLQFKLYWVNNQKNYQQIKIYFMVWS